MLNYLKRVLLKLFPKKPRIYDDTVITTGARPNPVDDRDYKTSFTLTTLPKRVMLKSYISPVRNQGMAGSCTAHAVVLAWEMENRIVKKQEPYEGSEQYNYYRSRVLNGFFPADEGSYLRDAFKVLNKFGCAPEKLMPYNDKDINKAPDGWAEGFASMGKIKAYYTIGTPDGIRQAIVANHPVPFSIPLFDNFYKTGTDGKVPLPEGTSTSAHAMCIIGYDDDLAAFYVQNSWGQWGNRGFLWLPYEYFDKISWFNAGYIEL